MVRARDLVKGATVVRHCVGPGCRWPGKAHRQPGVDMGLTHPLTLLDIEIHDGHFTAIAAGDNGEQCSLDGPEHDIVRVFADSVPQTGERMPR